MAEGLARHAQGTDDVGGEEIVEGRVLEIGEAAEGDDPGGVDDTVETPMLVDGVGDHAAAVPCHPEVGAHEASREPEAGEPLLVAAGEREEGAPVVEARSDAGAECSGCADHEDRTIGDVHDRSSSRASSPL